MSTSMWMMRTTQEHVNRAGKVPQDYAESASSYVKCKRWKSADSSHYICLIGCPYPLGAATTSTNFFNQEREFCMNDVVEEFVIQIHRPPTATPSPGYTNIAVRLERGEDGSGVQQEESSSSTSYSDTVVLSTFKFGMCISISRRDCDSAAHSATAQQEWRVKSKGLCFQMAGSDMELLGDLVLDEPQEREGSSERTLNFKIIDDKNDDCCIRFTRNKNPTNIGGWTIVKTTTFLGASSILESSAYNNDYFVSESENIVNNNLVEESCNGTSTITLQFVVKHGVLKESSNVQAVANQHYQASNQREIALLQSQREHEFAMLQLQREHDSMLNIARITERGNITTSRLLGGGCKCCEQKGCWDVRCNSAQCRYRCNCW